MPNSQINKKFHFDWSLDVGNVLTVIGMLVIGLLAYGDVKSDARATREHAEAKFLEYDKALVLQRATDAEQNERVLRVYKEFQAQLKETKDEIRADVRDLKTEVSVARAAGAAAAVAATATAAAAATAAEQSRRGR